MRVILAALFVIFISIQVAEARGFKNLVKSFNDAEKPETHEGYISLTGFALPKNYQITTFAHTSSFESGMCMNFLISPKSSSDKLVPSNLNEYIGKSITVTVNLPKKKPHNYTGLVTAVSYSSLEGSYEVNGCGTMYVGYLNSKNRLFVNQTEIEAIKSTLDDHKINYKFELKNQYSKREFNTRYIETDYNFIHRMMEENGLYYLSKVIDGKDTLVFLDDISSADKYSKEIDYKTLTMPEQHRLSSGAVSMESKISSENYTMSDYDAVNNKFLSASTNNIKSDRTHTEFQITDYDPQTMKKIADIKLTALNSLHNTMTLTVNEPDVNLGDRINIGGRKYYVISSVVTYICAEYSDCSSDNKLSMIPEAVKFANNMVTAVPMNNSTLVGFIGDDKKDDKGRLGLKFPWMAADSEMYRALLSGTAQKLELKKGDRVLVNFINGFPDRPLIMDKL